MWLHLYIKGLLLLWGRLVLDDFVVMLQTGWHFWCLIPEFSALLRPPACAHVFPYIVLLMICIILLHSCSFRKFSFGPFRDIYLYIYIYIYIYLYKLQVFGNPNREVKPATCQVPFPVSHMLPPLRGSVLWPHDVHRMAVWQPQYRMFTSSSAELPCEGVQHYVLRRWSPSWV